MCLAIQGRAMCLLGWGPPFRNSWGLPICSVDELRDFYTPDCGRGGSFCQVIVVGGGICSVNEHQRYPPFS